ncbi:MAG: FAD-dependent oxidoreductase [Candidatus Muiribacterium halophilum]|uniref:FAD-dependent oxidoreductase n=1 Tax=Muiribacterium halophilum TaxID=2053465 RepID=A0A2N5ZDJ1_MUIH1|nr:MAG: FAD-dependent oxidoreductase [Candidatus Muirbacterium halophilum]
MKKYDAIIIGAGPAGLFAAYELRDKKVLVIDEGKSPQKRNCPVKLDKECINCNPCDIMSGVGGAGLFSDGKLNFIHKLGKTDLTRFLPVDKCHELIKETEEVFNKFKMDGKVYPTDMKQAIKVRQKALKAGIDLLLIKQKHLGSDMLPGYINDMMVFLEKNGVEFMLGKKVSSLDTEKDVIKGVILNDGTNIGSKNVIAAPGRVGAKWFYKECIEKGVKVDFQPVEVGVRVEVPNEIMDDITDVIYDPTFFIYGDTFDDQLRTFCTNRGGFVAKENYQDFVCVNGHAEINKKSSNTNFAFLSKITLTEPINDTFRYGKAIGKLASVIGGGKPILQRFIDLKKGRRSTWQRINNGHVQPTFTDVVPGDISMAMPRRIVENLIDGLEKLDKVIPGIASNSTLLYAPEIKFFSTEIHNECLETMIKGLYIAGDGAGVAGNIVSAAATGLLAAKRSLENM